MQKTTEVDGHDPRGCGPSIGNGPDLTKGVSSNRRTSPDLTKLSVIVTEEVSVRAAAAEIIAADFYAAPTDSLLSKKFGSSAGSKAALR